MIYFMYLEIPHFIDEKIVWYGSINFLSFETSKESVIRIVTGSVAGKLIMSVI